MGKRIAIFGGAGQLGVELVRELSSRGHALLNLTRTEVDITHHPAMERVLGQFNPQMVVNAAAYNMVDVAEQEPQAAFQVNALAVRNMAVICRQLDAKLIHFSTDYVFDGMAGRAYTEEDPPHPLGAYAVSKLAGEFFARAYLDEPLVIRTSGVFGPGGLRTARGNFLELMLRLAANRQPIRVVEDHVASPTYAPALASRAVEMMERGFSGTYHIGGGTPISWYDYARLIFEKAGMQPELRPTSEREYRTPARRPRYSALSNAKMEREGIEPMPALAEAVSDYMARRMAAVAQ